MMAYQREFETRYRIGLVGAGLHAYRNLLPALNFVPVSLEAVCDIDADVADVTGKQYGARPYTSSTDMYDSEELDAVLICVSPARHPGLVREALGAGVHVWTEKPPALRADALDAMINDRGDRIVSVGFKKIFMPALDKVRELLAEAGQVHSILATYPIDIPVEGDRILREGLVTDWLAQGCHPLSVFRELGGPVDAVTVTRGRLGGGVCVLEFEDGAVGTLHLGFGGPNGQPFEFYRVFADGVHIDIENMTTVRLQRGMNMGRDVTSFAPPGSETGALVWEPQSSIASLENMSVFTQGFVAELTDFFAHVATGKPVNRGSLEFSRHVMELYEAALLSNGARVPVEQGPL